MPPQSQAKDLAKKADEHVGQPVSKTGMGQIRSFGHPLHPATVHFPIGFLSLSLGLDALQVAPALSSGLTYLKILPPTALLNQLSHYTGAAGILFSLPSLATGLSELYGMWTGQAKDKGAQESVEDVAREKDVKGEKLKTTMMHAGLNDLVLGVATYNWCARSLARLPPPPFRRGRGG
ncbi:hypothetical protein JCM6882_007590, partial [Rhodosporidiobolus microsporus]